MTLTAEQCTEYRAALTRFSYLKCRTSGMYEDDAHNALLALLKTQREVENPGAWLSSTVKHLVAGRFRRRKPMVPLDGLTTTHDLDGQVHRHQRRAKLLKLIAKLSDKHREIVTRFYFDEQPHEQITAEMGMSLSQFYCEKSRALGKMRRLATQTF